MPLLLSSCANDATREYDRARAEANPNWQDATNETTQPQQARSIEDAKAGIRRGNLFACFLRYSAYFNQADARFICDQ